MTDALDNLLKAAKAVARHEQAYRQCARTERWPITMPVGELFDLSDAVAAVEAAPAAVHALGEVEREATAQAIMRAAGGDAVICSIAYKLADAAIAALRHPQAPASGEVTEALAFRERVREAMQDTWNDICSDTDCHPLDIKQEGRKRLSFSPGHWAEAIAMRLAPSAPDDAAWLIEKGGSNGHPINYFDGIGWTDRVAAAVRFVRKVDGNSVTAGLDDDLEIRVVEHMWSAPRATTLPPSQPASGEGKLREDERAHVDACRKHLKVGAEIRTLSGQRALLAIIDRLTGIETPPRQE